MVKTYYSEKPLPFEREKFGAVLRHDIELHAADAADGEHPAAPQWSAYEFRAAAPYSQNKFIELAMVSLFGNDYENKLINEYNAANLGMYGDDSAAKIERYKAFLSYRYTLKTEIERICGENGVA